MRSCPSVGFRLGSSRGAAALPSSETRHTAITLAAAILTLSSLARAQTHWDVAAQAGVAERITAPHAPTRLPGPIVEIHGHVALYPMVRVGAYGTFELSPTSGLPDRFVYAGGGRVKLTPPWLPAPWHPWAFLGVGYAYENIPHLGLSTSTVEVPLGAGLGRKVSGPWELYAEIAARLEVAGLSWQAPVPLPSGARARGDNASGGDVLAVSLSVGVSLAP
jgi:hypothetical protein